jgi:hypothetical protein
MSTLFITTAQKKKKMSAFECCPVDPKGRNKPFIPFLSLSCALVANVA